MGDHLVHLLVHPASLLGIEFRQRLIPKHLTLHHLHDEEGATRDALIGAQGQHLSDRHQAFLKRFHDPEFALDGVCRWEQLCHWCRLGAHHIVPAWGLKKKGGVGLPPFEHASVQGALKAVDVFSHPRAQSLKIEQMAWRQFLGTREVLVYVTHWGVRWMGPAVQFQDVGYWACVFSMKASRPLCALGW